MVILRNCVKCGQEFKQKKHQSMGCYLKCGKCRYHESKVPCPKCGKLKHPTTTLCRACFNLTIRGPNSPNWKGGRHVGGYGYIEVWMPSHPNANRKGYVLEHRLVMGQKLGRPLYPDEKVHHRNGIKTDNRPENLEIALINHQGQKIEDMIVWAKEVLKRYEPSLLMPETREE